MAETGSSLPINIIYLKLPAEKGNIKKNRCCEFEIMVLAIHLHRAPSLSLSKYRSALGSDESCQLFGNCTTISSPAYKP